MANGTHGQPTLRGRLSERMVRPCYAMMVEDRPARWGGRILLTGEKKLIRLQGCKLHSQGWAAVPQESGIREGNLSRIHWAYIGSVIQVGEVKSGFEGLKG